MALIGLHKFPKTRDMDKTHSDFWEIRPIDGGNGLSLAGDWVIDNSAEIESALPSLAHADYIAMDASGVERMDMWGTLKLRELLEKREVPVRLSERQERIFSFIPEAKLPDKSDRQGGFVAAMENMGRATVSGVIAAYGIVSFVGQIGVCFIRNILNPRSFRFHSIVRHIDETGFRALPIVGLLAVLISMVIAYQASNQLAKFGASIFTIDLTVISLLREMGVLITAIMVAGRSGSAFAAEIGVMKLREEIDAMKTMGLNPIEILVLPRLLAMILTLPILTFLADIIGLAGGAVISIVLLDIPLDQYIERVQMVAKPMMFFVGMIKAPVFAFIITLIGTYQGMNVSGSAESVGKLTTLSVVQSIFLVIMADAIFSIVFARLGI